MNKIYRHSDIKSVKSCDSRRVLVIAPQPFYEDRGTPIALRKVLEAASELGICVDVLTYPLGEPVELAGIRIFRHGTSVPVKHVPIGLSGKKILLDLFLVPGILRQIKKEKYDCIHAIEESAFLAVFLRPWHHLPILYDMQSSLPEQLTRHRILGWPSVNRQLKNMENWLVKKVDRVICSAGLAEQVKEVDADMYVHEWLFPSEWIETDANEVQQLRKLHAINDGCRIVMYTGNFEPYQGVRHFIDSLPPVLSRVPDTVAMLIGGDRLPDADLGQHGERLLKEGVLKLIPRLPKNEVIRYLALADVVVSPRAYGDNIGLKIFDYMTAGKPIVASESVAHRSVLNDECALLVELTPLKFGNAIIELLLDEEKASRLGRAAKTFAEQNLSWRRFREQVSDLYNPGSVADGRLVQDGDFRESTPEENVVKGNK